MDQTIEKNLLRKVFIKTYGCQMNVYDSMRMVDMLSCKGYELTEFEEEADLVVLNTCHIREKAADKVYSALGKLRKWKTRQKEQGKDIIVVVAGCVAQAEGEEILNRAPVVDIVVGPQTYYRLPEFLNRVQLGEKVVHTDYSFEDKFQRLSDVDGGRIKSRGVAAFLTIQEGCDKFCTFCVVPYTRGNEVSRSVAQVFEEASILVQSGVREITLLGQNVNAWRGQGLDGKKCSFGDLLYSLAEIPGLRRLRYTTSHPRDMDDHLIKAHGDLDILMPYLHLPVQSGSNKILHSMNRRHTVQEYIRIIEQVRAVRSDIAISSDFIVGFPGETDSDFEETMHLVEAVGYAQAFSFKYSPRPGTPSADMCYQISDSVKSERLKRLQETLHNQQTAFNQSCIGKSIELLIEKKGRKSGQLIGRSPWLQSVIIDSKDCNIGDIVNVCITGIGVNTLYGEFFV
ncbi:tRNA-i(6)A37 methylthiotransferase [Liberibacter crescens BT-1]|uniref:tRNA-2-methylthio-N(6)-dimethylallyladenosine synthase n=1 Tax=Liberibacter crescens (strain BT-1) TaxID=1215343 RepID=L0ETJ6_LIBCB|nr:tRNA (N6-isopentenyl adenosine(37)-C2)-methylthiotransferase MiaB [Liberibacter crescens]AGA64150.1 tRNA-i(6)A37 methylthiotransferase [Liberibacter crescens BT-1]AMC12418.1 (dimethylallyl)adenosine tRNA methylthiotransferase [Liberibacter crescens]